MGDVDFKLVSVDEKGRGRKARRSKYDALLDNFVERGSPLVRVDGLERAPGYVAMQLGKRIEQRSLANVVKASCAMGALYLERVDGS